MKKKDIYFIIIFILIVSFSFLYLFQTSYAKYRRQTNATVQGTIANWNIKINNETIKNKTTLTNVVTPTIDTNQYVKTGTLAPGSTGYFDIIIDATEVDVDFTYSITGEVDEDTPLLDLELTDYKIGTGQKTTINGPITGDITKNTASTTIRVFFEWNDDENTNQMDNADDTDYATTDDYETTNIKVTIHFQQKR